MRGIDYLKELQIPIQVNTTVSKYNPHDLEATAEKVKEMGAVLCAYVPKAWENRA